MHNWCIEVWGDYACFTRPEMKVERVSYDVMTPSSARAIFESILWKPAIKWHITRIEVLNPIKWVSVRRNEVKKVVSRGVSGKTSGIYIEDERQQRAGLFLQDVRYRIHGYFEFISPEKRMQKPPDAPEKWADDQEKNTAAAADETEAKYAAMFERRAKKGQCFNRPYLGCREFSCYFKLVDPDKHVSKPIEDTRELGWMLYDMDFSNPLVPMPAFFKATIKGGVINTDRRQIEVRQ